MHADYPTPAIRQLCDRRVRFAPREKKLEQVGQAEKPLGELDPKRTLKQFDRERPAAALFSENRGPLGLGLEAKRMIFQQHHRGDSVEKLAKRYCRSTTGIHRVIVEMRARRIAALPLDFIPNGAFAKIRSQRRERKVIGPMPESETAVKKSRRPRGLPPYLASLYETPLLTRKQEAHLFRKFNYLKYKAAKLRSKLDAERPKSGMMDQIERLYDEAAAAKNHVIRANLRLVVSIAKRHVGPSEKFFELVSEGNMALMRAVERFDYSRGNKFSTYASWAIMRCFARTLRDEHRYRDRFRTSRPELIAAAEDDRTDRVELETAQNRHASQIERILGCLDEREQQIIVRRFGLQRGEEPLMLKQAGAELGVTKERIRQIEVRALRKLRKFAEVEKIVLPG